MPNDAHVVEVVGGSNDDADCGPSGAALLPANPYTALRFHFGMLLGVDDFETDQAYHRGKLRLHNAWLHRDGVVWGLPVTVELSAHEIRVNRGLALDATGHELHLDDLACLDVGAWFDAHRGDEGFTFTETPTGVAFEAHVVIRFRACLTRLVPSMSEPCAGSLADTAYSRVFETCELLLVPGPAPARPYPSPYHRLRVLFGVEDPREEGGVVVAEDQAVLDARQATLALSADQQPNAYLEALRRFAAFDEIDLGPVSDAESGQTLLFPAPEGTPVVLANVTNIALDGGEGAWTLSAADVDETVRPSHVATSTIQELLCGPIFASGGALPGPAPNTATSSFAATSGSIDAGGPRVRPETVTMSGHRVTFQVDRPLRRASVVPDAFSLTSFDRDGWSNVGIRKVTFSGRNSTVTVQLHDDIEGDVVRLCARGTGPTPLLGDDLVPLAGAVGGPPGTTDDGHDFVLMVNRS